MIKTIFKPFFLMAIILFPLIISANDATSDNWRGRRWYTCKAYNDDGMMVAMRSKIRRLKLA